MLLSWAGLRCSRRCSSGCSTGCVAILIVIIGGGVGYYLIGDGRWTFCGLPLHDRHHGHDRRLRRGARRAWTRSSTRATFTVVLLLFGTGTIVFFASTVTAFIIEGDLKNVLFASKLKKRMKRMKDHVVVCGAGSTGRNVIEELIKTGVPVVAIDTREDELKEIADAVPEGRVQRTSSATRPTTTSSPRSTSPRRAAWSPRCRATRTTST